MNLKITKRLLDQYQSGESEICDLIFRSYYERTRSYLYHLTKNFTDAEELAQETFIVLWEKRYSIESPDKFVAFLNSVVRNISLNYFRQKKNNILIATDDSSVFNRIDDSSQNDYISIENDLFFEMLVAGMPSMQKKVFIKSRVDGLSAPEIAEELGLSQSTVENHIYRATKHIKEMIGVIVLLFMHIK